MLCLYYSWIVWQALSPKRGLLLVYTHMIRRLVCRAWLAVGPACVCVIGPAAAAASDHHRPVRMAVDLPYAPMESKTPGGALEGFDIALGDALCRIADVECEWVEQAWEGIVAGLMARKYDLILSAMAITPERAKRFRIVGSYVTLDSAWFVLGDGGLSQISPETLAGQSLGVQRGTMHDRYVTDTYAGIADIKRYRSVMDMQVDLKAGRLAAVFITRVVGQTMFNEGVRCYRAIAPSHPVSQGMGMAFRSSDEALARRFEAALAEFKASTAYQSLVERWLSSSS